MGYSLQLYRDIWPLFEGPQDRKQLSENMEIMKGRMNIKTAGESVEDERVGATLDRGIKMERDRYGMFRIVR
jgi:hypothetical protein